MLLRQFCILCLFLSPSFAADDKTKKDAGYELPAEGTELNSPSNTNLAMYEAYEIAPSTPFYRQFSADYPKIWIATVDAFQAALQKKNQGPLPHELVEKFEEFKRTPPPLELLNSATPVAHYVPAKTKATNRVQPTAGRITLSTGFLTLTGYQRDRVLALLSHEMVHALQDTDQIFGKTAKIRTVLGKTKLPFIRMTAENMADELSVDALHRMGANPAGVIELSQALALQSGPVAERRKRLDWLGSALDEHRLSFARIGKAEQRIHELGIPLVPTSANDHYDTTLPRIEESGETKQGWDELEKWIRELPPGELFLPRNLSELKIRLVDIPVLEDLPEDGSDSLKGRFQRGQYHRFFSSLALAIDLHVDDRADVADLSELVIQTVKEYGTEFPIDQYHKALVAQHSEGFSIGEDRNFSLIEDRTLLDRDSSTLSFEEALVQLEQKSLRKLARIEMAKEGNKRLANPDEITGDLIDDREFSERHANFIFDAEKDKSVDITIVHVSARRYLNEIAIDEAFARLAQIQHQLEPSEFLAELDKLSQIVIHSRTTIASQSIQPAAFESPVAYQLRFAQRFPPKTLAEFKQIYHHLGTLPLPSEEKNRRLANFIMARFQTMVSPLAMQLTYQTSEANNAFYLNMNDVLNSIAEETVAQSNRLRLDGTEVTTIHTPLQFPLEKRRAEVEEALAQIVSDTYFLGTQLRTVEEARALLPDLYQGPIKRGNNYDQAMAFLFRPDVDQVNDKLHPYFVDELRAADVKLSPHHPVGFPESSANLILVSPDDYRFKFVGKEFYYEDKDKNFMSRSLLLRGSQVANERQMYWARKQFEVLEEFTKGNTVKPHGSEVVKETTAKKGVPFLRSADGPIGGPNGAPDILYPVKRQYSPAGKRVLASLMMDHLLDYYAGVPSIDRRGARELKFNKKFAPELARAIALPIVEEESRTQDLDDLLSSLPKELPHWFNFEKLLDSSSAWGLFRDKPEFVETLLFRHPVEKIHSIILDRLKKERGFDQLSPLDRLDYMVRMTPHENGSFILDPEIQKALREASPQDLARFLQWNTHRPPEPEPEPEAKKKKPKKDTRTDRDFASRGMNLIRYGTLHPLVRVEAVAEAMRGLRNDVERGKFAATMLPNPEAYREAWSTFLGDTGNAKPRPVNQALMDAIESHVPRGKKSHTASEEFYERMFHQLDLIMTQFDTKTAVQLAKFIAHPDRYPLSDTAKASVRTLLAPIFGAHEHNALEAELLRVYQRLSPDKQKFLLFGMLQSHPSAMHSPELKKEMANSPLFSQETAQNFTDLKTVVWNNMSHREKSYLAATVLSSARPEGKLADDDELIVENFETIGVMGRKTAQLLKVHGSFIRPSLRQALGKFRDDNVHSRRIKLIEELKIFFRNDLKLEFWDVVEEVYEVLGAGSMKTALHARLKDGREVVFKIVDPQVRDMAMRQITLAEKSVNDWQSSGGKEKGVVLYLLRRLRHAVQTEFDLDRERTNTDIHAKYIRGRGSKTSTPVCSVGELCSRNINTVEFIKNRGNANRGEASQSEHDALAEELLAQILSDRFVHGDLQNRANILLLQGKLPPAMIDLSLSEKVSDAEVNVVLRLFDSLGGVAESAKQLTDLGSAFKELLANPKDQKQLEALKAKAKTLPVFKDLTDADWKKFNEKLASGKLVEALETISPKAVTDKIADVVKILDHAVVPLPGEEKTNSKTLLDQTLKNVLENALREGKFDILDVVLGLEKSGAVFTDRYMFLLEAFALSAADLSAAHPKDTYGQLLKRFGDRIQSNLTLVRKAKYKGSSTDALIRQCERELATLAGAKTP